MKRSFTQEELAARDAEVAAKALEEAADEPSLMLDRKTWVETAHLQARAAEIRKAAEQ